MATTRIWNGGETSVAQVNLLIPGTVEIGDEFLLTIRDDYGHEDTTVAFTAVAATVANVTAGILTAILARQALFSRPWTAVTVTDETTHMTVTADTAGVAFYLTPTTVDGGGNDTQTFIDTASVVNVGQNDFLTPENYEDNVVAVSTDSVRVSAAAPDSTKDIAGGDYDALLLVDFDVEPNCYLNIGSQETHLRLDADFVRFAGRGNSYLDIIGGTSFRVDFAKAKASGHSYGLHIKGTSIALLILDPGAEGDVGVGVFDDAAAEVNVLRALSGRLMLGERCQVVTLHGNGATIDGNCAATTATLSAGTMIQRTKALATVNLRADAELQYNSTSLPTTTNMYDDCILDLSGSNTAWDAGTINYYGGTIIDPHNLLDPSSITINKFVAAMNITG